MADRLVQGDGGAPFDREGTVFVSDRTSPATLRAGVLGPQTAGLLLQQDAQSALGQARRSRGGDLLHGREVEGAGGHGLERPE